MNWECSVCVHWVSHIFFGISNKQTEWEKKFEFFAVHIENKCIFFAMLAGKYQNGVETIEAYSNHHYWSIHFEKNGTHNGFGGLKKLQETKVVFKYALSRTLEIIDRQTIYIKIFFMYKFYTYIYRKYRNYI